jgi:hypothetical protein
MEVGLIIALIDSLAVVVTAVGVVVIAVRVK